VCHPTALQVASARVAAQIFNRTCATGFAIWGICISIWDIERAASIDILERR